jgi:MFS family permease
MSHAPGAERATPLTITQWLICVIAAIGFAFDIYELLMLPLIARPALMELGGIRPGTPEFTTWISLLFYVPAVAGGIFGLLGGYLTDRLGRRRVLTWSILLYAFAAFAAGFSTTLPMLLFFRCLVFIGVCVEFVAAVAWLAELFPNPQRREAVLGFTQACSSIGGLLVAIANGVAAAWVLGEPAPLLFGLKLPAYKLPEVQLPALFSFLPPMKPDFADDWRYTLMSGLIPAIPLIVIRPFLPESPAWQRKRQEGTLKRPSIAELFSPELRRATIITTLMFTCSFAAAFGAIQQMPQIVPGLPQVKEEVAAAQEKAFPPQAREAMRAKLTGEGKSRAEVEKAVTGKLRSIAGPIEQAEAAHVTKTQEIGGMLGRVALAVLVLFIVSRRTLIRVFLVPGLIVMPLVFGWAAVTNIRYLEVGMFLAGFLTVAQFSFWGNYLPHVYPVHLRGTGESFAANIGGRLIGTCFFGVTQWIAYVLPDSAGGYPARVAITAAGVAFAVYLINFVGSFWLPEPDPNKLPE